MELGSGRAFITCPISSSMTEGLQGLLAATGCSFLAQPHTVLPGPSEEVAMADKAVKSAAAPALGVYIFFTQSSGIVHLFFKTQRGQESCIICKHCIIGYVVQSLLYSSSCENIQTCHTTSPAHSGDGDHATPWPIMAIVTDPLPFLLHPCNCSSDFLPSL